MYRWLAAISVITFALPTAADEAVSLELFEKHVRPTLLQQCIRCHGPEKQQGGLRLDSREALLKGGDSGPTIQAGHPNQSLLVKAIRYDDVELEMPPRGRLPDKTIAAIENWIASGAHDPRAAVDIKLEPLSPSVEVGREFWSFQPIRQPNPPIVNDTTWPQTDIDRFVLHRIEQENIRPVDDTDRASLLRRIYYDLIGLPPTPQQVHAFVNDSSGGAYEQVVDELLESPHFGQRWGRHWLDVVRFAESSGGGRTLLFPNAWRYRDYVIESFNNDIAYDQFIKEQIAGDLLESADWQDRRRKLTATAFLLLGPTNFELQDKDILEMDVVDEQLDTIGKAFMGMTIGCARCHDHKFDPIPAHDYYAMAGILKSTKAVIHSNVSTWNKVDLPLPPDEEVVVRDYDVKIETAKQRLAEATRALKQAGGNVKKHAAKSIPSETIAGVVVDDVSAEIVGDWMESTSIGRYVDANYIHDKTEGKGEKRVVFRPQLPSGGEYEVRVSHTPGTNRSSRVPVRVYHVDGETLIEINQKKPAPIDGVFTSLGSFNFDREQNPRVVISNEGSDDGVVIADAVVFIAKDAALTKPAADADRTSQQKPDPRQIAALKKVVDDLKTALSELEKLQPQRPVAMATTDEENPGDIHLAIRGVVSNQGSLIPRGVLQVASSEPFPSIPADCSGRLELAQWIADPQHPLTSRVMVNRIWYWLMGRGLVPTVDNFGSTGRMPTHPLLLDHLATMFVNDGWSVKKLVRRIVRSRVYQLSTDANAVNQQVDSDNRLLWRMNRKRLRAEDIRDTLLFVAGSLEMNRSGPSIKPGTSIEYNYKFDDARRSVYLPVFRNTLPELFEVFDFADPNIQQGKRNVSTIASQALLMMNHPFVIQQAKLAAAKMPKEVQIDSVAGVQHAYYQVLGRSPTYNEEVIAIEFVDQERDESKRLARWAMLYQTLFECVDFRYLN